MTTSGRSGSGWWRSSGCSVCRPSG
jgi:hypothetical protein